MRIFLGSDHAGWDMKEALKQTLMQQGHEITDMRAEQPAPDDDYPDAAFAVADQIAKDAEAVGILLCGNAQGMCIAANKVDGIRAAVGFSEEAARSSRTDDDANILCLPGRLISEAEALAITKIWLETPFSEAPRHQRRLEKVAHREQQWVSSSTIEIIPSILAESEREFESKLKAVEQIAPVVQVDILDGSFCAITNWHEVDAIAQIATPAQYELHLMVENPLVYVETWKEKVPGLKRAIFHIEVNRPHETLVQWIKEKFHLEVGVALNPETPVEEIRHILHMVDEVMVMAVSPGRSGQPFGGDAIVEKIRSIRHARPDVVIGVDGGVTRELVPRLIEAGATRFCIGTAIFGAKDPAIALKELQGYFKK